MEAFWGLNERIVCGDATTNGINDGAKVHPWIWQSTGIPVEVSIVTTGNYLLTILPVFLFRTTSKLAFSFGADFTIHFRVTYVYYVAFAQELFLLLVFYFPSLLQRTNSPLLQKRLLRTFYTVHTQYGYDSGGWSNGLGFASTLQALRKQYRPFLVPLLEHTLYCLPSIPFRRDQNQLKIILVRHIPKEISVRSCSFPHSLQK